MGACSPLAAPRGGSPAYSLTEVFMKINYVEGRDKGNIIIYTLSTCVWCKKTKEYLRNLGIGYGYVEVDVLEGEEKENAIEEIKRWNPACSFPSMVINKEKCIIGFDEKKIKEALADEG
jgi:glutaredoxin-like protein NrdH